MTYVTQRGPNPCPGGRATGVEKLRQGKVHFCGEHTSQDSQGYLNGGVETGERVAGEILGDDRAGILP